MRILLISADDAQDKPIGVQIARRMYFESGVVKPSLLPNCHMHVRLHMLHVCFRSGAPIGVAARGAIGNNRAGIFLEEGVGWAGAPSRTVKDTHPRRIGSGPGCPESPLNGESYASAKFALPSRNRAGGVTVRNFAKSALAKWSHPAVPHLAASNPTVTTTSPPVTVPGSKSKSMARRPPISTTPSRREGRRR